jgi:hypothetical protein
LAFNYSFKLNDEPIEATIGATVVDKLEEALDEGAINLPITVLRKEKPMLGLLEITIEEESKVCEFVVDPSLQYITNSDETDLTANCEEGVTRTLCIALLTLPNMIVKLVSQTQMLLL